MSKAKGKGKTARQKLRRRNKRAMGKADVVATPFEGVPIDDLTEEGRKLRHASKHCRNGMLGQMLFEDISRRMKAADNERMERIIVDATRAGKLAVTIADYYIANTFHEVSLLTLEEGEKAVLLEKYPVDCIEHTWDEDGSTCTVCGDKDWMATQLSPDDNGIVGELLVWADGITHLREEGSPPLWKSADYIILDSSSKYSELSDFVGDLIAGDIATEFQIFGGVGHEDSTTATTNGVTTDGNGTCE